MTNSTDLAAALLRDVPRHTAQDAANMTTYGASIWMHEDAVLAALSRALDPSHDNETSALTERAGEVVADLRYDADWGTPICTDAADLITDLLAQNAALRAEVEWWKRDSAAAWDKCEERRIAQEAAEAERDALEKHIEDTAKDTHRLLVAAEAKVEKLRGKIRDWEARIDAYEWSTNSSLTEDIRAEMRATLTTEERHDG